MRPVAIWDPATVADGAAVHAALRASKGLGPIATGEMAVLALDLMKEYDKPVSAVLAAVRQLNRDALSRDAAGQPFSTAQLAERFGRYIEYARVGDDGGRQSEAEHLSRKRQAAEDYERERREAAERESAPRAAEVARLGAGVVAAINSAS